MSRVYTRKVKARELVRYLSNGPVFGVDFTRGDKFTPEMASSQFKLWSQSWVLPLVHELVRKDLEEGRRDVNT